MRSVLLGLVFLMSSPIYFTALGAPTANTMTVEELRRVLKTEDIDQVVKTLSEVGRSSNSKALFDFLVELYAGRESVYPNLNWGVIRAPKVRIEIAHILVQAAKYGRIQADVSEFRNYALDTLSNNDPFVVSRAILVLYHIRNSADISAIEKAAVEGSLPSLSVAVFALADWCQPEADAALNRVLARLKNPHFKQAAEDMREEVMKLQEATGTCHKEGRR